MISVYPRVSRKDNVFHVCITVCCHDVLHLDPFDEVLHGGFGFRRQRTIEVEKQDKLEVRGLFDASAGWGSGFKETAHSVDVS
jgi:hypothetical protein